MDLPRGKMTENDSPSTGWEARMLKARPAGHDSRQPGVWYNNFKTPDEDHRSGRGFDPLEEQERERFGQKILEYEY